MKRLSTSMVAVVFFVLWSGCSDNATDSASRGTTDGGSTASGTTLDSLKEQAGMMANQARSAAEEAVANAQETAEELAAAGKEKFEGAREKVSQEAKAALAGLDEQVEKWTQQAKQFFADGNYKDALESLNNLSNFELSPKHQKIVDDLKANIESAIAKASSSEAAKTIGNLLGGDNK